MKQVSTLLPSYAFKIQKNFKVSYWLQECVCVCVRYPIPDSNIRRQHSPIIPSGTGHAGPSVPRPFVAQRQQPQRYNIGCWIKWRHCCFIKICNCRKYIWKYISNLIYIYIYVWTNASVLPSCHTFGFIALQPSAVVSTILPLWKQAYNPDTTLALLCLGPHQTSLNLPLGKQRLGLNLPLPQLLQFQLQSLLMTFGLSNSCSLDPFQAVTHEPGICAHSSHLKFLSTVHVCAYYFRSH